MRTGLLTLAFAAGLVHAETLSSQDILNGLDANDRERQRLEAGEILAFDGEAFEKSPRELSADAAILVPQSLDQIVAMIREVPTIIPERYVVEHADIDSPDDLNAIAFAADDYKEAERFLKAKAGDDLNLSDSEISMLQGLAAGAQSREQTLAAASDGLRKLLRGRFEAYLKSGLAGAEAYRRSRKKTVDIGKELALTTEALEPMADHFSAYYDTLRNYPSSKECCEHIFRVMKVELRDRPTWALSHTAIQLTDDYLLVTERHYYVTATLNSVQVTLYWVPHDENTHMGLAVSANTDILDSFLGKMLRGIGRSKARDLVTDALAEIRDELQAAEQ